MDILETREQWLADFKSGWLAAYQDSGQPDWSTYRRPTNHQAPPGPAVDLSQSRLLFVTSSGAYLRDQQPPFDVDDLLGDYTLRRIPSDVSFDALAYAHDKYDHQYVEADPQVLLPFGHLHQMVTAGTIGSLTSQFVSFMGYQPDVTRVIDDLIPQIVALAREEEAHALLLVPG
ncbi:MAG: hypothetical protein GYB68_20235 [Chloroflexi bacterium]|nr:hypothetical protein [Chloroflexota bacterium]